MDAVETLSNTEVVRECTLSSIESFKRTNHPTTSELGVSECTITGEKDGGREGIEKAERKVEEGVDLVSESGRVCQQSGCGPLSDVSLAVNDDDALGRNGGQELKDAKDSLSNQRTSAKDRKIIRKCQRYRNRGFVCSQTGEESDEDALKREALEAMLQESKRAKMRADEVGPSGWLPNRTGKPNKRFLSRLLAQSAKQGSAARSKSDCGPNQS